MKLRLLLTLILLVLFSCSKDNYCWQCNVYYNTDQIDHVKHCGLSAEQAQQYENNCYQWAKDRYYSKYDSSGITLDCSVSHKIYFK